MSVAPAARAALAQANALWPDRNRASDGLIGDAAHRSRRSWHNPSRPDGTPDPDGMVYAFDLTHDPAHGCDAHILVTEAVARRDPRVMEAISRGEIWTKARAAEGWRSYRGSNPHDKHAHVTVDPAHADDTSPWWRVVVPPQPAPTPGFEEAPVQYVRCDVSRGHEEHGKVYFLTGNGRTWMRTGFNHMHWLAARGLGPKPDPARRNEPDQGFDIDTWPVGNVLNFPYLGAS